MGSRYHCTVTNTQYFASVVQRIAIPLLPQFGRVLYDLAIELICANSSEAKGRVERANQTLQDRLIKEMRLEGITGIEAANAWLATFIADFNRRFSRPARFPKDLHRPVKENPDELRDIFAWHDVRTGVENH
ncbi:Sea24 [Klebsiella michiganensis]|uniref:Sea24 n=1 Tax=Klebsiella michiganensis TaxID=1134687 RepID=A0A7H4PR92_9ENTR|nr:Sea24 [Klebsiella michiganensis]